MCAVQMTSDGIMIYIPSFMTIGSGLLLMLKGNISRILEAVVLVLLTRRLMNYSVLIDSGVLVYMTSFVNTGSTTQKLVGRKNMQTHTDTYTHRQESDLISLLLLFQNKEIRLKMLQIF
jgi:hypothetical protein